MENTENQPEEDTIGKPFVFNPMITPWSPFEIKDPKPKPNPPRNAFQIIVGGYLLLLTAALSYFMYQGFHWHWDYLTFKEEVCSLQCLERVSPTEGARNESSTEQRRDVPPNYEHLLSSLNGSIRSVQNQLEEEIGMFQVKSNELYQRFHNVTSIQGPPGMDGPSGPAGIPGQPGRKGDPGPRGGTGEPGSPGAKGDSGLNGEKGEEGKMGRDGEMGPAGPPGSPGNDGTKGEVGLTGPPGEKGEPGDEGIAGTPGSVGPPGITGQKGEKGDTGVAGSAGLPGTPGRPGEKGEKGNSGSKGDQGQKGDRGMTGLIGPPGTKGEPGIIGPSAPKGEPGSPGLPGPQGPKGEKGTIGSRTVRLVPGPERGRVELEHDGEWGTICDDGWDNVDGNVICRMLGYSRAVSVFQAGGGTGKILLDDVNCKGNELTILDCPKPDWERHNCNHNEDAGVQCTF